MLCCWWTIAGKVWLFCSFCSFGMKGRVYFESRDDV